MMVPSSPDASVLVLSSLGSPTVSSLVEWKAVKLRKNSETGQSADYRDFTLFPAGITPAMSAICAPYCPRMPIRRRPLCEY
ncbi:uncharacterized protein BDV14DRAFT_184709 [Aspergillus stella-maris]|uniref:uncharacterized protein n=1 Tax=Aspergillus stella-maris TaxID=1810926 RepID=UPI003CCD1DB6